LLDKRLSLAEIGAAMTCGEICASFTRSLQVLPDALQAGACDADAAVFLFQVAQLHTATSWSGNATDICLLVEDLRKQTDCSCIINNRLLTLYLFNFSSPS
jgi:hypothetical protein